MIDKSLQKSIFPLLVSYGFTKRTNSWSYRIRDGLLQFLYFEKIYGRLRCQVCILPLYTPTSELVLTFGDTLGWFYAGYDKSLDFSNESEYRKSTEELTSAIEEYVLPWFDNLSTSKALYDWYSSKKRNRGTSHYRGEELLKNLDLGFIAAYDGKYDDAEKLLGSYIAKRLEEKNFDPKYLALPQRFLDAIRKKDGSVQELMSEWTIKSIINMKLVE